MARRRKGSPPSYRLHKQSGQAIVSLPKGDGKYQDVLLGPHGSPESHAEYRRVLAEWEARGRKLAAHPEGGLTVAELMVAYWAHAEKHYRHPDGTPTGELNPLKQSLRPLKRLYAHTPAAEFGPLALKAVRQHMIDQGLSRKVVNQRVRRIKAMFRWAESEELVPPSTTHALSTVAGLRAGRSAATERQPVTPVPREVVEATLPFLRPVVVDMVRLQLLCGMRPGEVVNIRGLDIDTTGPVWLFRPGSDRGPRGAHKTAWRGHERVIPIGPRGQEIVRRYLKPDPHAYLFSPAEAVQAFHAERGRRRRTKVPPSQARRPRTAAPRRKPKDRYTVASYGRAVARACNRADRDAHKKDPAVPADRVVVPHWHPHQLRHSFGTEVRRRFGAEAAQTSLGHRQMAATEIYAEKNLALAVEIAASIG
jgi:integrase